MSAIAIDWSGAKKPKGKIWIAEANRGLLSRLEPLRSRDEAIFQLLDHLRSNEKAVAGLDFGFSLPAWFCREKSLSTAFELWALVEREGERWLQECCWPFWGRPGKAKPELEKHYRRTEERVGWVRGINPKSIFQIGGAGAVGTGSIRGMPFLSRIREQGFHVWPFDVAHFPVVVEIYPRVLTGDVVKSSERNRADYLITKWPNLSSPLNSLAVKSEDAFDAAISALIMDAHLFEFGSLPPGDEIARLEGEIWVPSTGSLLPKGSMRIAEPSGGPVRGDPQRIRQVNLSMKLFKNIIEKFKNGEYAVSDHAIMEARKDGIEPKTIEKLEYVAINGKIIEEYPDRKRISMYSEIKEDSIPVHIVIDYSEIEEPVIVTCYVPDSKQWIKCQIRKK